MSARTFIKMGNTTVHTVVGKSGSVFVEGVGVKFTATEGEVDVCGANDECIGIAQESLTGDGVKTLQIALLDGGVVKVKASATATQGKMAICGVGGFENQTLGGATAAKHITGMFLQSGVVGDMISIVPCRFVGGA